MNIKKYIGDKNFYFKTLRVALPISLQVLLGSGMAMVDTMMVSRIGMVTAVGNAGQMVTLSQGISFGIVSGIAMFASQFFGAKNEKNLKKVFGLSLILGLITSIIWVIIAYLFGDKILYFYLPDKEVLVYSLQYLKVVIFSLILYALNDSFSILYRSMHKVKITLNVSIIGALANVFFNFIFIFVLQLGVVGAALGTVVAQFICFIIYLVYSFKTEQPFIGEISEMFDISLNFVKPIFDKMWPLMLNETMFGLGMTLFVKAFGFFGTDSMDAFYIATQIYYLFMFIVHGYGSAVSVLIGTRLGEGRIEIAIKESRQQMALGFVLAVVMVSLLLLNIDNVLSLFNIGNQLVYGIARSLLFVYSIKVFLRMFNFLMFSTLRAGGDTKVLNFLDSGLMYLIGIPIAFISVDILDIKSVVVVLLLCQIEQVVRFFITLKRYRTNKWAIDLTKKIGD
jgi:putative MATE family efflux protein